MPYIRNFKEINTYPALFSKYQPSKSSNFSAKMNALNEKSFFQTPFLFIYLIYFTKFMVEFEKKITKQKN